MDGFEIPDLELSPEFRAHARVGRGRASEDEGPNSLEPTQLTPVWRSAMYASLCNLTLSICALFSAPFGTEHCQGTSLTKMERCHSDSCDESFGCKYPAHEQGYACDQSTECRDCGMTCKQPCGDAFACDYGSSCEHSLACGSCELRAMEHAYTSTGCGFAA